jgi:hypothetical protein
MDAPAQGSAPFLDSFNFQRIVLTIAIVMLIAAMIFIGYSLYARSSDVSWPPAVPACPDFWTVDPNGNCMKPSPDIPCEYNGIPAGTEGVPTCPNANANADDDGLMM